VVGFGITRDESVPDRRAERIRIGVDEGSHVLERVHLLIVENRVHEFVDRIDVFDGVRSGNALSPPSPVMNVARGWSTDTCSAKLRPRDMLKLFIPCVMSSSASRW